MGDQELVVLEPVEAETGPASVHVEPTAVASTSGIPQGATGSAAQVQKQDPVPAAVVPTRDRIVVIGRRSSGKTIYLASLYQNLWRSRDGLSMKALSGRSHKELINICETLRRGEWPQATQKEVVTQMEFELEYRGRRRILVGLDYGGEVFRDAFVNDDVDSPQAKALVSHIDRAMAVILLIDPAIAVAGDTEAQVDDDYGIVQAIQRVRDWPGGEDVPAVLLLTKGDQNRHLFSGKESTRDFVGKHYPALVRTLKNFKIFHGSAVQTCRNEQGLRQPKADSVPFNIIESLRYCLDVLETREQRELIEHQQEQDQRAFQNMLEAQAEQERQSNRRFALGIASFITIAVCIMVLILVFNG